MPWPDTRDGTAGRPPQRPANIPGHNTTATSGSQSLPDRGDRQYRARWRLADERRRLGIARLAHELMPLTVYYRGGLVDVPLGRLLARGRWAA